MNMLNADQLWHTVAALIDRGQVAFIVIAIAGVTGWLLRLIYLVEKDEPND